MHTLKHIDWCHERCQAEVTTVPPMQEGSWGVVSGLECCLCTKKAQSGDRLVPACFISLLPWWNRIFFRVFCSDWVHVTCVGFVRRLGA